jgi:hypothetical protein
MTASVQIPVTSNATVRSGRQNCSRGTVYLTRNVALVQRVCHRKGLQYLQKFRSLTTSRDNVVLVLPGMPVVKVVSEEKQDYPYIYFRLGKNSKINYSHAHHNIYYYIQLKKYLGEVILDCRRSNHSSDRNLPLPEVIVAYVYFIFHKMTESKSS